MMKPTIFLVLIVSMTIGTYAQEKKSSLEGAWKSVQIIQKYGDKTTVAFPGVISGDRMTIFSKEHFVFAGTLNVDTTTITLFGGGTYKLDGNKFEANMDYNIYKSLINKRIKYLLEIQNDTLIIIDGTDDNWNLLEKYTIDKYVRLD